MTDQFNPYCEWLGIETKQPPDHYELLQIPRSESQPQVISAAAAAQMAKIRGIRPGPRVADWQRLLDELAAAKNCLCDPAAKARYDEQQRQRTKAADGGRSASSRAAASGRTESEGSRPQKGAAPIDRSDSQRSSGSRDDLAPSGKNLLPPTKSPPSKQSETDPAVGEPKPAGPALNPMPPSKHDKPAAPVATPIAAASPDSRATADRASILPAPGPSFPGAPVPGAPLPGDGLPAGAFPAGAMPSAPIYPQPIAGGGWPWPVAQLPAGAVPISLGGAMPFSPSGVVPGARGPMPPAGSPAAGNPPVPAAGQPFLDDLLREEDSQLDEIGLSGKKPVQAAAATSSLSTGVHEGSPVVLLPDDDPVNLRSFRSRRASGPRRNSSHAATIAAGIVVAALVVGAAIAINNNRRNDNIVADASPNNSNGQSVNPTPKTPANPSPSPHKIGDVAKTNPAPSDPRLNMPRSDQPKKANPPHPSDPPDKTALPDKATPPDNVALPDNPFVKLPAPMPDDRKPTPDSPKPLPDSVKPMLNAPMPDAPKAAPSDPAVTAKIRQLLSAARIKLGERNQEAAKKLIAEASQLAASDEQHDLVDRVDSLEKYVGEFWSAVHDSVKGLKAADEIDLGSTKVIVVEASAEALTIHVGGQNRRYQVNQLPSGLAVGLALRWLDPKKPENKVFVGAFYLVDPKTGPEQAKQAWDEAAAAGIDVKNLLPLLPPDGAEAPASR